MSQTKYKRSVRMLNKGKMYSWPRKPKTARKHTSIPGHGNTQGFGRSSGSVDTTIPDRPAKVAYPDDATPARLRDLMPTMHALGGNLSQRNGMEMLYYQFHKRQGRKVRGKYRPR